MKSAAEQTEASITVPTNPDFLAVIIKVSLPEKY